MKKLTALMFYFSLASVLFSCKKDSASPVGNIEGTWNFVSMDISTNSTVQETSGSDVFKTETTASYTTENNSGKIVIDATSFNSQNLAYSVNSTAVSKSYDNGALVGTSNFPLNLTLPASSGTSNYTLVGTDSIYFAGGSVFSGGVSQSSAPSGGKLSMDGNTLYITQIIDQSDDSGGYLQTEHAEIKLRLQKQ